MKKTNVTIQYDEEKLLPIRKYMSKKGLSLEDELIKIVDSYYTKHVPAQVREYFEMCADDNKSSSSAISKTKPKHQVMKKEGEEK